MVGHGTASHMGRCRRANAQKCGLLRSIGRQLCHVPGRGVVCLPIQPVGIFKVTVRHSNASGQAIHGPNAWLHPAAGLCQCQGCIVAGGKEQSVEQALHRYLFPRLQVHRRPLCHVLLGHLDRTAQLAALQHHQCRKDLGGAGHQHPPVRILFVQDAPRVRVHQHRRRGRNVHSPGPLRQQKKHCQHSCRHAPALHAPSPFLLWMVPVYAVKIR